ncbi:MAG: DUF1439 domain-containing protein [Gammaproteobacteria bacterium]|nr:DUF1439 domain-containing protein [Gammaproteobacteria bacterium]MCP5459736.1 DUF1439 domain-containing protein [Gammaproteobacteria bacterium]
MKRLRQLALYGLLTLGNKALSMYRLKLSRAVLQRAVASRFPLQTRKYLLSVTLSDPEVILEEETQRIGIEFAATMSLAEKLTWNWRGIVEGGLEYRRSDAAFYLRDLRIRRIDGAPPAYPAAAPPNVAERLLQSALADYPLYRLDEGGFKQALARLLVKSVRVGSDGVLVELGLY